MKCKSSTWAKQPDLACAASSVGGKWRLRVAAQDTPQHRMPDAVERKLASNFQSRLSFYSSLGELCPQISRLRFSGDLPRLSTRTIDVASSPAQAYS